MEMWNYIVTTGSILAFIGSMITLLVNFVLSRRVNTASSRTYLECIMIDSNIRLENSGNKKGAKLFHSKEYRTLTQKFKDEKDRGVKETRDECRFLKVENIGSNPCFDVKVRLTLKCGDTEEINKNWDIYSLKEDEEIYIPLIDSNFQKYTIPVIEVKYKTIANETLIYRNEVMDNNHKKIIVMKSGLRNQKLITIDGPALKWETLK
ncbi:MULTISPECIES: hypothetical protein [Bacillus]|uniref:hypothetical protein n=1 Tax=Bacillus TaxID=1386 RepID=UPI000BF96150|nr:MULTISPECIES: hypothetical protein [Bacillus]PER23512.1 hypothetical protein CN476_17340 [Bacillus cereus]PGZ69610.1 hypothetical protein COE49_21440 [Bacillus sp. AFS029637]